MVRIELKNFQSIADEALEIEGFSAVTGRSNIGKSAIVRAIKAAITGAPVDCYVRHAANCPKRVKGAKTCKCFCSVRIVGDGLDLLWEKGDSINRYVHNGVEHTVVGRGTPEFLGPEFGMINLGPRERTTLQVADQFHPLFILDKSGTVIADVLSDVAKLDQINVAIRLAEKDRKEASGTRRVREKDIADLKLGLAKYDGLDAALSQVNVVEGFGRLVEKTEEKVNKLSSYYDTITVLARSIKSLSGVSGIEIPPSQPLRDQQSRVKILGIMDIGLQDKLTGVKRLSGVTSIDVPSLEAFNGLFTSFSKLSRWVIQVQGFKSFFARGDQVSNVVVPDQPSIQKARDEFRRLEAWAQRLTSVVKMTGQLKQDFSDAEASESAVLAEFADLGVCPTCKQDVKAPHHQGAHAHA